MYPEKLMWENVIATFLLLSVVIVPLLNLVAVNMHEPITHVYVRGSIVL